jgi:hypothetical protein
MKYTFLIILTLLIIGSASLDARGPRYFPRVTRAGKGIVNTKVDNIGYWKKMVQLGYVEPETIVPVQKAVFSTSKIFAEGRFVGDSPDVPVTGLADITQSENSVFVSPEDEDIILNSNNSTDTNQIAGIAFYGADNFHSNDAALSWGGSVLGTGGSNSGDPTTAIGLNGWWYVGMISGNYGQSVAYSTNQGLTWTAVEVAPGPGSNNVLDKNHLWIDNKPTSPYSGYLYDAWSVLVSGSPDENNIQFTRSSDQGLSWITPVNISAAVNAVTLNHGVNIHTGSNGEVYVTWSIYDDSWPSNENAIGFAKSIDGGAIFAPATRIINNIRGIRVTGTSKAMRVNSFPSMTTDVSGGLYDGNIYVVWANNGFPGINTGNDIDIYMIRSEDKGETWSAPIKVNQDPAGLGKQHFFPWITSDPDNGNLCVVYYDDRNVSNAQCETWVSYSNDGGDTWSDMRVSDVAFTPSPVPGLAAGYFGDYLGITSKNMKVYPAWTDNRSGRAMTYVSPVDLGPLPNQPYIVYNSFDLVSMTGQTGQTLNFTDSLRLSLGLKNIGDQATSDVTVFLSSPSPYITINDSSQFYGHFNPQEVRVVPGGFSFRVSDSIPDGLRVRFDVRATNGDSTWYSHFGVEAHAPSLAIRGYLVNDSLYGNNNKRPDPGELVTINVAVQNTGDFECLNTLAVLGTSYQFVSIVNDTSALDTIMPGQIKYATFNVDVSNEAAIGTAFIFEFNTFSGYYNKSASFHEMIGIIIEDWETNSFTKFPWFFGGDKDWIISNADPWEGTYCAKSGLIHNLESTELNLGYESSVDDSISFFRKVSSEPEWDYLAFYIDSIYQDSWSGDVPWGRVSFPVTAGAHSFKWIYSKDIDISNGLDRAWLDNIEFPPPFLPAASAGPYDTICAGEKYLLQGTASDYDSVKWFSNGDGTFSDPRILNPLYTPGPDDILNASVRLKLVAYGPNGNTPGFMYLAISDIPTAHITVLPDDTICSWQTVYLYSNASGAETYLWTPGNFPTQDIIADLSTVGSPGSYWFRLVATNTLNCDTRDSVLIHFKDCLGVEDMGPLFVSEIYPVPNEGIFTLTIQAKNIENIGIRMINPLNVTVYEEKNWIVTGKVVRRFDFTNLPAGVYFLELDRKEGKIIHKVLIRN